ncbi:MAG: NADH-quinone oxidoreductase subunit NuoE [Planctomycetota bacterium]|jgi:NADH-quinone oxidoreductase subunit E
MAVSEENRFPREFVEEIEALFGHYPRKSAALVPALHLVQDRYGYISDDSIDQVSEILEVPPAEILGTLSFYTMFRREPSGRFHVNICKNLSCTLTGARDFLSYLEEKLDVKVGETTEDGLFTLGEVECLGACTEAPVMEIDGDYFFRLTPEKMEQILDEYREKTAS